MLTASKVEMAHRCEASLVLPQRREKHAGQDEGNERHKEWEDLINAGGVPDVLEAAWPGYTWRAEVAFAYDLATGKGRELGVGLGRDYGEMGPLEICGTADAVGRGPNGELAIADRKSFDPRVKHAAHNAQLATLALAATRTLGLDECEVGIFHEVRKPDVVRLDMFKLEGFHLELRGILERAASARARHRAGEALKVVPGDHCRYCDAFHNCPAQKDLALELADPEAPLKVEALIPLASDADALRAYEFWKRAKMLTKRLGDALYARAKESPIPLGNGLVFGERKTKGSRELDADKAYEVVRDRFGQEPADKAVTREATQTGLERALGKTGKAEVMKLLEQRGGISHREGSTKFEEFDPKKQLKDAG